ncbi:MAG: Jag N-terminal domain-containing protein [Deltaproteobacteria bacterium]|nr:Jag N-terminal domain-containing protein [Deltaproteobacteria bacterium]MBW1817262.1 Jag N-terminal domain-containing protein [Deltaproteobacteria bacterium]MBW2284878.1 Jag N-terminal domain-containing protein [Deltaproteobacteria bacterium]
MKYFEFEAKTADAAIQDACRQLELTRDQMDIEVLEPGTAGIFGLVGGRKAKIKVGIEEAAPADEYEDAREDAREDRREDGSEDDLEFAADALETILGLIPMEGVSVHAEHRDGTIALNIDGDKSGLLIGRKGKTLDSLQFILNKIVNKKVEGKVHVVVDSENYRQRRYDSLVQMGMRMGDKAKQIRKPVATNLLNAHDRRIIHMTLRDDDQLDTKSRGEGLLKKVIIIPKK